MPINKVSQPKSYSYNVICDRCGFKYKNYQLRKEYDGFMVCYGPETNKCWEPRHPQEFVKGVVDAHPLPFTRPEPAEIDVSPPTNPLTSSASLAGSFNTNNSTL